MKRGRGQRGFTLLEVAISIGIIALISGAIFAIVQGVYAVATQVEYGWNRHQQIYRFAELLRTTLREMPQEAVILSEEEDWNGTPAPTLVLRGASLGFGGETLLSGDWETVIQAREKRGGRLGVHLYQRPIQGTQAAVDYQETEAIEILPDLIYLKWEFRQVNGNDWLLVWRESGQRPALVRLELVPVETEDSQFFTFWVPGSPAPNPNPTTNPSPSPSPSPSPGVNPVPGIPN